MAYRNMAKLKLQLAYERNWGSQGQFTFHTLNINNYISHSPISTFTFHTLQYQLLHFTLSISTTTFHSLQYQLLHFTLSISNITFHTLRFPDSKAHNVSLLPCARQNQPVLGEKKKVEAINSVWNLKPAKLFLSALATDFQSPLPLLSPSFRNRIQEWYLFEM